MIKRLNEKKFERPYAKTLLSIAEGDLRTAKALTQHQEARIENAFYMVQQAIEKALKAVLIMEDIAVPMVHDLGALLAKLPEHQAPPHGYELTELSLFATIKRYEEGHFEPTVEELQEAIGKAEDFIRWAEQTVRAP